MPEQIRVNAHERDGHVVGGHLRRKPDSQQNTKLTQPSSLTHKEALLDIVGFEELEIPPEFARVSPKDVVFALEYPDWSAAGFTHDSNWHTWALLGYEPYDARPGTKPPLTEETLLWFSQIGFEGLPDFDEMDTSDLKRLDYVFSACDFNEPLNDLDVSKIESINKIFRWNQHFNHPLNKWKTSSLIDASFAFYGASSFDQSLASWDISKLENADRMLIGSGMSRENLADTIVGWAATAKQKGAKRNVSFVVLPYRLNTLTSRAQKAARYLEGEFGWSLENPNLI